MIILPCKPSDSLDWKIPDSGEIFWRFDLGLEEPFFPIDDELRFQSLALALAKFTKEIWPHVSERSRGALLYQGTADFSRHFSWTEKQRANWEEWKENQPAAQERFFAADAFAHYFQLLAHKLPDELPLYLRLDASSLGNQARAYKTISRERFEHFQIAVKRLPHFNGQSWEGESNHAAAALCFPADEMCTDAVLDAVDAAMLTIEKPFRIIHEPFLTEEWEGVDELYVISGTSTPQGIRMLRGFEAAGGRIYWVANVTGTGIEV